MRTIKQKKTKTSRTEHSTYARPKLREFGPVGALTQGGSGAVTEGMGMGMGMGDMDMNPMRAMT